MGTQDLYHLHHVKWLWNILWEAFYHFSHSWFSSFNFIVILGLWDSFLEGRIKLQKVAGIINQMPQFDIWKQFERDGGEEFRQSSADSK